MSLQPEQVRALDQLRQRLSQLVTPISSLRVDLERSEPLPPWDSLMQHVHLVTYSVQQANEAMNAHRDFLRAAHAYPLTTFPGHREEDLLGQLMRKKLEPKVEDWIAEYTTAGSKSEQANGASEQNSEPGPDEYKGLWNWAGPTSNAIVKGMVENGAFDSDFTVAETEAGVENVVTGLKRKLYDDDDEEDDDDDEDEKMDDVMPTKPTEEPGIDAKQRQKPMEMERMLKFMSTGTLPA